MRSLFNRVHHALHRHHCHPGRHSHRGFAGFGGHFGFGGRDGAGFGGLGRGRKLGSADLQLLLLALLAERPSHGYELIRSLDERSHGYYVPSPGMVYPALTYLEELGHASVESQGSKKLYRITEAGLSHLESQRAGVDAMLEQLAWLGDRMDHLRRAMHGAERGDDGDDFGMARDRDGHGNARDASGTAEVRAARRNLKSALIGKALASEAEQRRVAQVLERAAAEIRGDGDRE